MRLALLLLPVLASLPARAQLTVIGNGVEEHQVQPGGTYSGTIRVLNTGGAPADARVYLTDYAHNAAGETSYGKPGSLARSNAGWVRFSPAQVRVAPGAEATIGYTITIPAAAGTGTYWSMLMVEGLEEPSPGQPRRGGRVEVAVGMTVRYGVQLATTIPGAAAQAQFANPRAMTAADGRRVELDLSNSGLVAYRPKMRLELYDEAGNAAGTFSADRGLLYPGMSLRQRFDLVGVAAGSYQALITADTGGEEVFGAQYRLEL